MSALSKTLVPLLTLFVGLTTGANFNHLIKLNDAASSWTVHEGTPLYYSSARSHYSVADLLVTPMTYYDPDVAITLSPNARFRLLSYMEPLDMVKDGMRYSHYFVLDEFDELKYKVTQASGSDLKAHVAAVSDDGVLALVDPISAHIQLYKNGERIVETPLYQTKGDYSLERKARVYWQNKLCYVLIERPGFEGAQAENVLLISIDASGNNQKTKILPFTYLQQASFHSGRIFISGYSYNAIEQRMSPLILEANEEGDVLWTNEHFGHELAVSNNGKYLAAKSNHGQVVLFDLEQERVQEIDFAKEEKVALGLSVDNSGEVALIRVVSDFFIKRNTHFAEVFFPKQQKSIQIQLDPKYPPMFQLYSDGNQFYLGTRYEWLEISE
ncbi:MAG: hypothetical protein K9N35_02310 [Candidatus Marinimicrobia bacterium]|nr:hypothetical protein [Candidatus Neomarinimicrobiota bacterium]